MIYKNKQSGVTFLGFLMVCAVLIFFAFLGMRMWPLYNEKIKVDQALENIAARDDVENISKGKIVNYILRHFEVEDVDQFERPQDLKDIFTVERIKGKKKRLMRMNYEIRRSILDGKLDIVYIYDKSLEIKGVGE